MERMDEILSHWVSKIETFPEGLRERQETGCCASDTFPYAGDVNSPGHELPPE